MIRHLLNSAQGSWRLQGWTLFLKLGLSILIKAWVLSSWQVLSSIWDTCLSFPQLSRWTFLKTSIDMAFRLTVIQRLLIVIGISCTFCILELAVGFRTSSLAMIADGFHVSNDLIGFIIALIASIKLQQTERLMESGNVLTLGRYTFGFQRAEVLGAFFNGGKSWSGVSYNEERTSSTRWDADLTVSIFHSVSGGSVGFDPLTNGWKVHKSYACGGANIYYHSTPIP